MKRREIDGIECELGLKHGDCNPPLHKKGRARFDWEVMQCGSDNSE